MKLELSIGDDRELRAFIKDLIKGEVKSIARGEIKSIIAQVVGEKVVPKDQEQLDKIVHGVIRDEVRQALGHGYGGKSKVLGITREIVREYLKQMWEDRGPIV